VLPESKTTMSTTPLPFPGSTEKIVQFTSRDAIYNALFYLLCQTTPPSYLGGKWNTTSRDLDEWTKVPAADQPALYVVALANHGSQLVEAMEQWKLMASVIVYYKRDVLDDPANPRDTAVLDVIDMIDKTIHPIPGEHQTLGGLVHNCYVDGTVMFDAGLTDTQAVVMVPITMEIGAFGA
jgi:hypothetical protein